MTKTELLTEVGTKFAHVRTETMHQDYGDGWKWYTVSVLDTNGDNIRD